MNEQIDCMLNGTPFRNEGVNQHLRTKFQQANIFGETTTAPQISRVGVVGAIMDTNLNIHDKDHHIITRSINAFANSGVNIAPDVSFDWYNLLAPMQNNFLRAALVENFIEARGNKIDCVIICYILRHGLPELPHNPGRVYTNIHRDLYDDYTGTNRMIAVDFNHNTYGIWTDAANAMGAKFIAAYGDNHDEISSKTFEEGDEVFTALVPPPEKGDAISFAVRNDQLATAKNWAKPEHELGKRLLSLETYATIERG